MISDKLILAVPKGRILKELMPLLEKCGIEPEAAFSDPESRLLQFKTNHQNLEIIRVRAFDVATFTAFGAAHLGVVGSDVIDEFNYDELYAPVDLKIGGCRLSVAMPDALAKDTSLSKESHVRVVTKYPNLTHKHFAARGVQTECIKLNGAMELAPSLGLTDYIVDLVSTGATLKSNGLKELMTIANVSSRLIIHRQTFKTRQAEMQEWIEKFKQAVEANA